MSDEPTKQWADEAVLEALAKELVPYVEQLLERLGVKGIGPDGRMRALLLAVGDRLIARHLEHLGQAEPSTAVCPACGAKAKRNQRRPKRVLTISGPVTYRRSEYRCECGQTFAPLDAELGLVPGSECTAALRELMAFVQAEEPVETTAQTLEKLLGFPLASSVVDRAVQIEGARAETLLAAGAQPQAKEATVPDTLLVEVDGCHAPERDGWHEVKSGVVTDAAYRVQKPPSPQEVVRAHQEGRRPRGREVLVCKGYVAARRSLGEFKDRLWEEVIRWRGDEAKRIVLIGDGAPWIWNLGEELFHFPATEAWERLAPQLIGIVDWYHASEHLWDATELIHGTRDQPAARRWARQWERKLWDNGDAKGVARALRRAARSKRGKRRKELLTQAGYFETNAERMLYPHYRAAGLPVGSGPVEGACKTIVQARCKRAGMRWKTEGLSHILVLRLYRLNHRWKELWPLAA